VLEDFAAIAESVGADLFDQFYLKVWATTTDASPVTVTLGCGRDTNRSSINVPVPCLNTGVVNGN
jgi:hypothetical protein